MRDKTLEHLVEEFYEHFNKAQELRRKIMDHIEDEYDVDVNEHWEDFEDSCDWCYGINLNTIDQVDNKNYAHMSLHINNYLYGLTDRGKQKVGDFIAECNALKKEVLDAGKDTATETNIPTEEDILSDIEDWFEDGDDGYFNNWGVTDNYDLGINLYYGEDFVKTQEG